MRMQIYQEHTRKMTFYLRKDGAAFDVTGATITIQVVKADDVTTVVVAGAACVLEDALNGEISYTPANTDIFADAQRNLAQFKIVIGGKDERTETFELDVKEKLD